MHFNALIPEFAVKDVKKSVEFYAKTLGFKVEYERPESKFVFLSFQGSQLMLEQGKPKPGNFHLQIRVRSLTPLLLALKKSGHPLAQKTHTKWYRAGRVLVGNKQFYVRDPDGYLLRFFEDLGRRKISGIKTATHKKN